MPTSLAVKYRPSTFDDVVEQGSIKTILTQQLASGEIKHGYLFCGSAGTGKTTSARIFANEINKGIGTPIEMDAASHNSVEDIRSITQQSKTKSLVGEYKVFILDEVHALSSSAWQAFLKVLEEPPANAIFILCTTDPQKIPKTILSRVQRYDFHKITHEGIVKRLKFICENEGILDASMQVMCDGHYHIDSLAYIAKIAEGGMRDAITLMEKCLAFSSELNIENVVKVLGTTNYDDMFSLLDSIIRQHPDKVMTAIENVYMDGKDLKLFIKTFLEFLVDVLKWDLLRNFTYTRLPSIYSNRLQGYSNNDFDAIRDLLPVIRHLNEVIKWETNAKTIIEATLLEETLR